MVDKPHRRSNEANRRKDFPQGIIVSVLALICIGLVVFTIIAVAQDQNEQLRNPAQVTEPATSAPISSIPSQETTPPTENQEERIVADLIKRADFVAAGYDYQKAIQMLKTSEYYGTNEDLAKKEAEYQQQDSQLITYSSPDTITHIFFHSLIVDTERAFDKDTDQNGYNMYMTTLDEFNAILEAMYQKGYVLISPYDMAYEVTDESGSHFTYGQIRLPAGKIPFLMSQDDLNYYSYMIGTGSGINETPVFVDSSNDGFAHKIVIDSNGFPTCEYMAPDGTVTTGDYDLVPALETFIQQHPDFSYRGARAILGMTGYEGVFGYRTKPSYEQAMGSEAYAAEVQAAKDVAQCLRDHGWILASHSYGHPAYGNLTPERVERDSDKWENTVQSIIGDTDVILYPYGSDIAGIEKYTFDNKKFEVLYEDGYRYFFNVDGHTYWNQLGDNYFRGGRRNLDGYRMYHNPKKLSDLFDVDRVFDPSRPTPVPSTGPGM
jgi:hypothetical protein